MIPISFAGRLISDPELKFTPSGAAVVTFGVACNKKIKDESGSWVDGPAAFFDVQAWRQLAEDVAAVFNKGDRVVVIGTLAQRQWTTPEGQKRSKFEVTADDVGQSILWMSKDRTDA